VDGRDKPGHDGTDSLMCIACEMGFWGMVEAMSPEAREQFLREQAERFACDAPPEAAPQSVAPGKDERTP
jgi:hypothetical protein